MGIIDFYTFIITATLFIMTPGIDSVFVINKSVGLGKKAGLYSTLGVSSGVLIHTLFAALGLSIIVAQSAYAFSIIKYLGAAYLVFLGLKSIFSKSKLSREQQEKTTEKAGNRKNFISGIFTNTLNPRVALFFLAFFPQFIDPDNMGNPMPFLILGATYTILGLFWFSGLTFFSSSFSKKLFGNKKFENKLKNISGSIYILMGLKIAFIKRN